MIRRPVDISKLLFLYFLKSSAALASEPAKTVIPNGLQPHLIPANLNHGEYEPMGGYISLRIARRTDILSIQKCNLASLPENYNEHFYANHMRQWPELALVAEHVPNGFVEERRGKATTMRLLGNIAGGSSRAKVSPLRSNYDSGSPTNRQCQIVGYVLGKVDQTPRSFHPELLSSSYAQDDDHGFLPLQCRRKVSYENMGHVTSLAILDGYRRKGLAAHLMKQLHHEMKHFYDADAVGLHVRVSNAGATNLYANGLGYRVDNVHPEYYQDGEDAYLMRKDFILEDNSDQQSKVLEQGLQNYQEAIDFNGYDNASSKVKRFRFPAFHNSQYKTEKRLMLPRIVFEFNEQTNASTGDSQSLEPEQDNVSTIKTTASFH